MPSNNWGGARSNSGGRRPGSGRKLDKQLPEGYFVYVLFNDQGFPFYVGYSSWRYRLSGHEKHIEFKQQKRIGIVLRDGLHKEEAVQLEAALIAAIGIPPLVNKAIYRNSGWHFAERRILSIHTRQLMSQARTGKVRSLEQRERMSQAMLNRYRRLRGEV